MATIEVSEIDKNFLRTIRKNVSDFMERVSKEYTNNDFKGYLLDIAPQIHEGSRPYFNNSVTIHTLDIDSSSKCDFISDICNYNHEIKDNTYDYVVCTEVLEHTLRPFDAVEQIKRILKPGGKLFLTVPFNFRIHGPLPDCWRFTEHGIRSLLRDFSVIELNIFETPDRPLMPIHYTVVAEKI